MRCPSSPTTGRRFLVHLRSPATFRWTLSWHSARFGGGRARPVHNPRRAARRRRSLLMVRVWAIVIAILCALGFAAWASDFVTMQGERTVYTVDCVGGSWQGDHCSGHVAAGTRYRFRALKPHGEVIFWTVGSKEPSGRFNDCQVQDGTGCARCAPTRPARSPCRWRRASPSPTRRRSRGHTAPSRNGAGCSSSAVTRRGARCRRRSPTRPRRASARAGRTSPPLRRARRCDAARAPRSRARCRRR